MPQMDDFFKICEVGKSLYESYLKKKDEYFTEVGEPEKGPEKELLSKRELKTLTRVNLAFIKLVSRLIEKESITKK